MERTDFMEYACVRDLEVEGRLQLDDASVADCLCRRPNAVFRPGCEPEAEEFRQCVELVNELKEKLNALIGALT